MSKLGGSWLEGPTGAMTNRQEYAGKRLGLPADGPGSTASQGRKVLGYVVDLVAGVLIGGVVRVFDRHVSSANLSWAQTAGVLLEIIVLQTLTGQSIGQRLTGTRIIDVHTRGLVKLRWVVGRVALTILPIPGIMAVVTDDDQRGLHDKACGTLVVRV